MTNRFISKMKARLAMATGSSETSATIFSRIYKDKLWSVGDAQAHEFWSGTGSMESWTREYEAVIARFVTERRVGTLVDLGCGDFQVGRRILAQCDCRYVGVDVVPDLIARNTREFGSERVAFVCADIAHDTLPDGDLCLIRQVLQHLDNTTIARVLDNVRRYASVVITESQSIAPKTVNADIKSGPWTRTLFDSGLYFDQPPFSRPIETLLEVQRDERVRISTCLLKH